MPTRRKVILWVIPGFFFVLMAALLRQLPVHWRGLLVFAGGWLMAIGVLYQVGLYAKQKDTRYYLIAIFAGLFWLAITAATVFWWIRR